MSTEQIDGQLDVYDVLELIEKEKEDDEEEPANVLHLQYAHVPLAPGDRAICGAVLKGVDHGLTRRITPDICVVCIDLAGM